MWEYKIRNGKNNRMKSQEACWCGVCVCTHVCVCVWLGPFCVDARLLDGEKRRYPFPLSITWKGREGVQEKCHFLSVADTTLGLKDATSVWQNNFELKNKQPLRWWAAVHFIIYFCCVCTQLPPFVTQQFKERSSCQKRKWGEGKAPTVNVTGGDNARCASCPHPCN